MPPQPSLSTFISLYFVENISQVTPSLSLGTLSINLLPGQPKCGVSHGKILGQALGLRSFHPGIAIKETSGKASHSIVKRKVKRAIENQRPGAWRFECKMAELDLSSSVSILKNRAFIFTYL